MRQIQPPACNAGVLAINVLTRRFIGPANEVNIAASAAGIGISVLSAIQSHYSWKQASADLKRLNVSAIKDNLWKAEHDRAALDRAAGYYNARLSTLAAGALFTGICSVPKLSVDSKGVVPRGLSAAAFLATAAGVGLY